MQIIRFLTFGVLGAILCQAQSAKTDVYAHTIQVLGGVVVDPMAFPQTVAGFQAFLSASAVKAVTASELTKPNHPEVAARLGFPAFLPERSWWPRGAALALLTQNIQSKIGAAVHVRNWWRPSAYNTDPAVGGARNGDHPTANAVDLDYPSVAARMAAELYLRSLAKVSPWMQSTKCG